MTFLLLNLMFLATLIMFIPRKIKKPPVAWWFVLGGAMLFTLILYPVIIMLDVVAYSPDKILGLKLFGAPIEVLFYALYTACIVPLVWNRLGERSTK